MNYPPRPTWAEIDLKALRHNLDQARKFSLPGQRLLCVVKADAYGHGAVPVARALECCGITDFAVATLEEALELREAGLYQKLLVLGGCFPGQEEAFIRNELMPALFDEATAERLQAEAMRLGLKARVHLKVDSGMGRVGFLPDQLQAFLPRLKELDALEISGFMSHLACADDLASGVTAAQQQRFDGMLGMLRENGIEPADIHLNNSAGLSGWGRESCTMARPGIMLYGGLPGPEFSDRLDLQPVMHLRSCIAQLRQLPAGSGISYGHTFRAERDMTVAVLPIGYADGFNRLFSNCGQAILKGQVIPLVGRVCMDWILFDVSPVPDAAIGDCVTLLGSADGESFTGDDWAERLGTISYEVFCRIGKRVPRRYLPVK
ncbi:MAG: alanine racemase [Desulfuromonas sp.]|nr:MAG: alanine racemase [Desulfuromonas sp.]